MGRQRRRLCRHHLGGIGGRKREYRRGERGERIDSVVKYVKGRREETV
jgi:hypothetical protein